MSFNTGNPGDDLLLTPSKRLRKAWISIIPLALLTTYFLVTDTLKPNSWNILYYELGKKEFHNPEDSLNALNPDGRPLIPHTFFERGSSAFKKYKRGDTVPIFENGKIVGEINLNGNKLLWSNIDSNYYKAP